MPTARKPAPARARKVAAPTSAKVIRGGPRKIRDVAPVPEAEAEAGVSAGAVAAAAAPTLSAAAFVTETVALDRLRAHPRNYLRHPDDEVAHLMASITEHGFYRPIVVGLGDIILAGHGVVEAARRLGYADVPIVRRPYGADDPRALKLLAGDNEIRHLAEVDDRALTELLRELRDTQVDLLGTGYDDMMLANLTYVTRPVHEIGTPEDAAAWVGLPEYEEEGDRRSAVIVNFRDEADRRAFCARLDLDPDEIGYENRSRSVWWPPRKVDDTRHITFTDADAPAHPAGYVGDAAPRRAARAGRPGDAAEGEGAADG